MSTFRELSLTCLVLALAAVLAFAPDHYLPMLMRSFLLEWVLLLFAVLAWAMWQRKWWITVASASGVVMVLVQISVPCAPDGLSTAPGDLRIAHMNVFQPNNDHVAVIQHALGTEADVLSFQEVSRPWADDLLTGLGSTYPYHRVVPRANCTGIALFSKHPFDRVRTITIEGTPFIEAVVRTTAGAIRVFAVHATSPGSYGDFRRRNAQLDALADVVRSERLPTMVLGDLNTVHWDDAYERFCVRSGARPVNTPIDITWPSVGPLALIPLDHLLVAGGLRTGTFSTFAVSGSDHRGFVAELHLAHAS